MLCRCDDNCFAMSDRNGAWKHDKSPIRIAGKCSKALCNFGSIAHAGRYQPYAKQWCGSLNGAQICSPCRIGRIKNHCNSVNTGRAFLKQLQPLPSTENSKLVKPVILPSGRARLVKKPAETGSTTCGGGSERAGGKHHVGAQFN